MKPYALAMSEGFRRSIQSRFKGWILSTVIICLLGVSFLLYNAEPRYGGRRISTWMTLYTEGLSENRAQSAIYAMGADAVPHLAARLKVRNDLLARIYERSPVVSGLMDRLFQGGQRFRSVHPQAMVAEDLLINAPKDWDSRIEESMIDMLSQGNSTDQITAFRVLHAFNPDPKRLLPLLRLILQKQQLETSKAALEFIRRKKIDAKPLEDEVIALFQHKDPTLQDKALIVASFSKLDVEKSMPFLKPLLDSMPGSHKKRMAMQLLSSTALPVPEHISYLETGLDDPSDEVRRYAVLGLGGLGHDALDSLEAMLKLLSDEDFGVRMTAADAIGDVGPGAIKAIPELIRTLNNDFSGVGQHCRRAIQKIDPEQAKNIMIR